eukprot:CAMPEP_0119057586 /NCGR_PEP_ID=MMETSP1178-20130426/2037_1 /TAXON_ID=33656 /ORGANISM="unid sp, Strain CCMP2000" /LENGTH=41 /DNA_ID= /DNA_START= /DNA_END= /DNA_ORIENTATION=
MGGSTRGGPGGGSALGRAGRLMALPSSPWSGKEAAPSGHGR